MALLDQSAAEPVHIDLAEAVRLGATDSEFYARTFFPRTFRQESPPFARDLWEPLEDPRVRLANLICFRGSSKTTRLRTFASKRIAYGISRTILCVGVSESDAIRSVRWIRNQVERNRLWASAFHLKPGGKWEETQIELWHEGFQHTVWVQAAGINGSLRGINFDDYRPDLIIVDDPQTDEMAASEEQRLKVRSLIMGTLRNSLAPASDEPNAKLVMAITPQHSEDVSQFALRDPEWTSRVYPCWTKETLDLPVEEQQSSWEERFPTAELRAEKLAAARRNDLSTFAREKECRIIAKELARFRTSWLNIRETPNSGPRGSLAVLAIDPVPPPSDRQMAKGFSNKDYEAHYVWGFHNGQYHLLDRDRSRGHEPSWTVATAFRLARQWRVARIVVDAVAYQRTLKWILEQEMKRRGIYYTVVPIADGMKKYARISNVLSGLATEGLLWVGPEHTEFIEQFTEYGPTYSGIDDDLDASALALQDLAMPWLDGENADQTLEYRGAAVEELPVFRGCP